MMIILLTLGAVSVQHDLENADLDYGPQWECCRQVHIYALRRASGREMENMHARKKQQSHSQNHINPYMIDTGA